MCDHHRGIVLKLLAVNFINSHKTADFLSFIEKEDAHQRTFTETQRAFRDTQKTFREQSDVRHQRTLREHAENTHRTLREHAENTRRILRKH